MATANAAAKDSMVTTKQGFTIIELIVVMLIMGVLMTMAMISYQSIQQRYQVEQKVKQMYSDLMNTRIRAMQRSRDHFVTLATGTNLYRIYEDTITPPDGNGQLDAGDALLSTQSIAPFTLVLSTATLTLVQFNSKGLVSGTTGWVQINSTASGEYDCVKIEQIKTAMGKINGANCDIK
jgi:prepilin-type N-terminal cleavage/methylation domain-containing protein